MCYRGDRLLHLCRRCEQIWRRHIAYKNVKSQLRRVDRPYTVILNRVRNISRKSVAAEYLRCRVSVWWHPLV
jgi:hypothetical protein